MEDRKYYVICYRHNGNGNVLFWSSDFRGYSTDMTFAGVYTAKQIASQDWGKEDIPVPCSFLEGTRRRVVLDIGDSANQHLYSAKLLREALANQPKAVAA